MEESRTCTTITIAWTGSNAQSWRITNSLGWTATVEGEGGSGSHTFTVTEGCGETKTATLRLYSGPGQTGNTVSQAFSISTLSCSNCTTTTTTTTAGFSATASGVTSNAATLSWSNAPAFTTYYYVWRQGVTGSTITTTSYEFTGLSASTSYTLNVEAKNSNNATLAYASAEITTLAASGGGGGGGTTTDTTTTSDGGGGGGGTTTDTTTTSTPNCSDVYGRVCTGFWANDPIIGCGGEGNCALLFDGPTPCFLFQICL
jgi:hypothetical protein